MTQFRFTMLRMLVAVAMVAGVLGALIALRSMQQLADQREGLEGGCYSSLNHIAMALHAYGEEYGRFPQPFQADEHGVRKHSWRLLLLDWYPLHYPQADRYNLCQSWDGPENSKLSGQVPGFMGCPSELRDNTHGPPFIMINDFGESPIDRIPSNAILVLEAWGANRNWLDPHDRVEMTPQLKVKATDHPSGFGLILRDFSRVRVRDTSHIGKVGGYYVLEY